MHMVKKYMHDTLFPAILLCIFYIKREIYIAILCWHIVSALSWLQKTVSQFDVLGVNLAYIPVMNVVILLLELLDHLIFISAIPGNGEVISISAQ